MATGVFTLACELRVKKILADGKYRVRGVRVAADNGREREISADYVVSSAGAIESARLLLLSGFGNHGDQLGRHLQSHLYTGAVADFDIPLANGPGPGPTVATCEFNHGNEGVIGGGMIANDFPMLPIQFWTMFQHRAPAPWGILNKRWMQHAYHHTQMVVGPTQEIPNPDSRIELDTQVKDSLGIPVARLAGTVHPETLKTGRFMRERAKDWLAASGGKNIQTFGEYVLAGQHQAGTCRMGTDPATSVTDPSGRVHDIDNLYVADASLHVSNGGFNPGLTVMALASLVSDQLLERLTK
jgi:choline dehydrogenase-like flavoprotein